MGGLLHLIIMLLPIALLVFLFIRFQSFTGNIKEIFNRETPVEQHNLTLENRGIMGFTAADFQEAILGESTQQKILEVYKINDSEAVQLTKNGLANLKIFSKNQLITYGYFIMIDITFDFRSDSKGRDPDTYSPTLNLYHRALWSKELPNGEVMDLQSKGAPFVLTWKEFSFTSDTIIVEMRSLKNQNIIDRAKELVEDFEYYYEHLLGRSYTIGSMIIFPVHRNSMNQRRGMNILISDRWDLTLECIRRHYAGEQSPLSKVIETDKAFYDLFGDFKGYVDYFFLQDCVSEDYSSVDIWMGDASFSKSGLPETVDDYFKFILREHIFLDKRNRRIQEYCIKHG